MVGKCRAGRATALCLLINKTHITVPIARAEGGDARAVLDLIKVDKLFLSDSCTSKVIRKADFRNDREFLTQLARAIAYKPHLGWKKSCRLYFYVVFSLEISLPAPAMLVHWIDSHGMKFKTFSAFERFFERCREDFDTIQGDLLDEH
jgi:hypothetical protein